MYIANYNLLSLDRVFSKGEVRKGREAGIIHRWFTGVVLLAKSSGHNRLSRLSAKGLKTPLISWLLCSVLRFFVFVGVDSNHFRYVLDFEVTVQGLVGDVPGGAADYSEHF